MSESRPQIEVFYEVDATELKDRDKKRRYMRTIGLLALYFLIMLILYPYIFELSLIVLFILLFFLPAPFVPSLAAYKITNYGIIDSIKDRKIPLKPEFRFIANVERKFVSVFKGRRELFMLYTPEPMRVMRILERVSKIAKPPEELEKMELEELMKKEGEGEVESKQ